MNRLHRAWYWLELALVAIMLAGGFVAERVAREDAVCAAVESNTAVLRRVIEQSYGDQALVTLPNDARIDDPDVIPYLQQLVNGVGDLGRDEQRKRLLALLPDAC